MSRSLAGREPLRPKQHARLRERLRALAGENRRFGYRRLHALLEREGWRANHKLIARLYQEERLAIRRRHRQKRGAGTMSGHWCPIAANQRWSMDFTEDTLASGRKFRTANLKDDCTRECSAILVDFSLPGRRVTLMLTTSPASAVIPISSPVGLQIGDPVPLSGGEMAVASHGNTVSCFASNGYPIRHGVAPRY
jgi:putative transposase